MRSLPQMGQLRDDDIVQHRPGCEHQQPVDLNRPLATARPGVHAATGAGGSVGRSTSFSDLAGIECTVVEINANSPGCLGVKGPNLAGHTAKASSLSTHPFTSA